MEKMSAQKLRDNAVVIGNGTSRLNFDLNKIKDKFTTYGCNALYRDFIPDYLISMDIHMVTEIINARVHHKTKFYTQHVNDIDLLAGNGEPINFVKTYMATPDSGTAALDLASDNHELIYIIGFDYHQGKHNNVYAGTTNYNAKNYSTPIVQDDKWRSRLYNIVKQHDNIEYVHVTNDTYEHVLPNITTLTIERFKEIIC
jgi:hypothetical protein